jgi:hypothetical protein
MWIPVQGMTEDGPVETWVNTERIAFMQPRRDGRTRLVFDEGLTVAVVASVAELRAQFADATPIG